MIDYSQLKRALKEIATLDLKIYTESSRLDLNAVIVEAQALINNAESQEQVDSMIKKLNIAFKELKLIGDTTDDNELPGTGVSSQSCGIGLGLIAMGYVLTIRKRKSRLQ